MNFINSKIALLLLSCISFVIVEVKCNGSRGEVLGDVINELSKKVFSYQALKEQPYAPPFKWYEKQGLFKSEIRVNTFGNPIAQGFRDGSLSAVYDNDMFSTGWIITTLLETQLYGKGVNLETSRIELALRAIGSYNNKNEKNFQRTLLRTFWPQTFNSTYNIWQQQPINIRNLVLNFDVLPVEEIEKVLKFFGLKKLIALLDDLKNGGLQIVNAFSIPPDFDDTYLNLGLGAILLKMRSKFSNIYREWANNNTDVDGLISATVKYSYEPFDTDLNKNFIDTRTYFFLRNFILDAVKENRPVSLITTWIQNIDEQRKLFDKRVSMPFNLNNVDVTVGANSIYGITAGSIYNVNGFTESFLKSPKMIQTYLNTTRFIAWAINSNFTSRPDLAQVYYPSKFNFMWYASRTLFLIENQLQNNQQQLIGDLQRILAEAKGYLQVAFENRVSNLLLATAIKDSVDTAYFVDFLGLNDTNVFDKPSPSDVDAIFSTSQAVNILIATWTYQNANKTTLQWKSNTPEKIKNLIRSCATWLVQNTLGSKYKPMNAFFSGSVKGFSDLPFWYPNNFVQFLNGTMVVDPDKLAESDYYNIIDGVSGYIDEETFEEDIKKKQFGQDVPIDFNGYNIKGNEFPFWSSEPYTYSVALLALSQFNNIEQDLFLS